MGKFSGDKPLSLDVKLGSDSAAAIASFEANEGYPETSHGVFEGDDFSTKVSGQPHLRQQPRAGLGRRLFTNERGVRKLPQAGPAPRIRPLCQ